MKRSQRAAALLLGCLFLSFSASADVGFYVGVEAGQGRTQLEPTRNVARIGRLVDTSSDREDTVAGLYVGYSFTDYVAVELEYDDFGDSTAQSRRSKRCRSSARRSN